MPESDIKIAGPIRDSRIPWPLPPVNLRAEVPVELGGGVDLALIWDVVNRTSRATTGDAHGDSAPLLLE